MTKILCRCTPPREFMGYEDGKPQHYLHRDGINAAYETCRNPPVFGVTHPAIPSQADPAGEQRSEAEPPLGNLLETALALGPEALNAADKIIARKSRSAGWEDRLHVAIEVQRAIEQATAGLRAEVAALKAENERFVAALAAEARARGIAEGEAMVLRRVNKGLWYALREAPSSLPAAPVDQRP